MISKLGLRKKVALAASLVLASGTILSSAASAAIWPPRDPVCDQQVADACAIFWQDLGYAQASDCTTHQKCYKCPPNYGYMCGYDPRGYAAVRPDQPW